MASFVGVSLRRLHGRCMHRPYNPHLRRLRVGPLRARLFASARPPSHPTPCATRVASTPLSQRVFPMGGGP